MSTTGFWCSVRWNHRLKQKPFCLPELSLSWTFLGFRKWYPKLEPKKKFYHTPFLLTVQSGIYSNQECPSHRKISTKEFEINMKTSVNYVQFGHIHVTFFLVIAARLCIVCIVDKWDDTVFYSFFLLNVSFSKFVLDSWIIVEFVADLIFLHDQFGLYLSLFDNHKTSTHVSFYIHDVLTNFCWFWTESDRKLTNTEIKFIRFHVNWPMCCQWDIRYDFNHVMTIISSSCKTASFNPVVEQ